MSATVNDLTDKQAGNLQDNARGYLGHKIDKTGKSITGEE